MTETATLILLVPWFMFMLLVGFGIFEHGEAELALANDARTMALNEAYHLPAPCPSSTYATQDLTCALRTVVLSQNNQDVTVHMIDLKALTTTYGIVSSYIQAQAVVPSDHQANL